VPNTIDRLKSALADRYEIERQVGQGGMATVYLARDIRHQREVAIKVLRPELAAALGPERFLREIRIAANLAHPHILPLYDSGEADGFLYYVMPYIEGDTLRARIEKEGELPVAEAVKIIREIADALAFAHSKGVVHRDIKPDNVMLTGGHAVVTDFGVAKAISEATGRDKLTTAGVALGTPAYMAPEQATADPHIDHRADIYAIGAVAYELLTGRTPFTGATPQSILAAHVTEQVEPVSKYRDHVTAELEAVVMRCLEKKPADRWQSAEELLPHLETVSTPSGGLTPTATQPVSAIARQPRLGPALALVGIVILLGIGGMLFARGDKVPTTANNTAITRDPGIEIDPRFSRNGAEIAYTGGTLNATSVYVRSVGGGRAISLTDDVAGFQRSTFWSPDGENLVFGSRSFGDTIIAYYQIPKLGGASRLLRRIRGGRFSQMWDVSAQGILAFSSHDDSIMVAPIEGGDPELLAVVPRAHSMRWSPDGSRLAVTSGNLAFTSLGFLGNIAPSSIWIVDAGNGTAVQVTDETNLNTSPVWMPDGEHLLFVSDRDGPRDVYWVRLKGSGEPAGEPVRITSGLDAHSIDVSADGRTVAYSQFRLRSNIWTLDPSSSGSVPLSAARRVTAENQIIRNFAISRDGRWLAFDSNIEGNQDIFVRPLEGGEPVRVTTNPADDFVFSISTDGSEVAFHSLRTGNRDIFIASTDGGEPVQLTRSPAQDRDPYLSPDGRHISFRSNRTGVSAIHLISRDEVGGQWGEPELFRERSGSQGQWSSDGEQLVMSDGQTIFLKAIPGEERVIMTAPPPGVVTVGSATWSTDGRLIYFLGIGDDGTSQIWFLPTAGGLPRLRVSNDEPLLDIFTFREHTDRLYFVLTELESDIFTMDLVFE